MSQRDFFPVACLLRSRMPSADRYFLCLPKVVVNLSHPHQKQNEPQKARMGSQKGTKNRFCAFWAPFCACCVPSLIWAKPLFRVPSPAGPCTRLVGERTKLRRRQTVFCCSLIGRRNSQEGWLVEGTSGEVDADGKLRGRWAGEPRAVSRRWICHAVVYLSRESGRHRDCWETLLTEHSPVICAAVIQKRLFRLLDLQRGNVHRWIHDNVDAEFSHALENRLLKSKTLQQPVGHIHLHCLWAGACSWGVTCYGIKFRVFDVIDLRCHI